MFSAQIRLLALTGKGIQSLWETAQRSLLADVPRALQYTPCLQLSFDSFQITFEKDIIHNPSVEEALWND